MVRRTAKLKSSKRSKYSTAWKIGVILALVLVSFWELVPTIRYYSTSEAAREAMDPSQLDKLRRKILNLGLDLQGGYPSCHAGGYEGDEGKKIFRFG